MLEDPEAVEGRACSPASEEAAGGGYLLPDDRTEVVERRVRGGDGGMFVTGCSVIGRNPSGSRCCCCWSSKADIVEGTGVSS